MSRRMIFVVAVSAVAGLCVAFLLGDDRHSPRSAGASIAPEDIPSDNPADDMAKALRKAIEGAKAR